MKKISKKEEFNTIINNRVLVYFYADWCSKCIQLNKMLEEIDDKIEIVKVDIDKYRSLAKEYKVMTIPSLKLFDKGKIIREKTGLLNKEQLIEFIDNKKE